MEGNKISIQQKTSPTVKEYTGTRFSDKYVTETLVESIWEGSDGRVTRDEIRMIAYEVAASYQNATVDQFLPIFIHRETSKRLRVRHK
jgi:hypothetical protein